MSSTNGFSNVPPFRLKGPIKTGKQEIGRATHCVCSDISAQLAENKVIIVAFLHGSYRLRHFVLLLSVWVLFSRSMVYSPSYSLLQTGGFVKSVWRWEIYLMEYQVLIYCIMDTAMVPPAVLPPVPSAERHVAMHRSMARLPAPSTSKTSTLPLTSQRVTERAPGETTACLHGTSCWHAHE